MSQCVLCEIPESVIAAGWIFAFLDDAESEIVGSIECLGSDDDGASRLCEPHDRIGDASHAERGYEHGFHPEVRLRFDVLEYVHRYRLSWF